MRALLDRGERRGGEDEDDGRFAGGEGAGEEAEVVAHAQHRGADEVGAGAVDRQPPRGAAVGVPGRGAIEPLPPAVLVAHLGVDRQGAEAGDPEAERQRPTLEDLGLVDRAPDPDPAPAERDEDQGARDDDQEAEGEGEERDRAEQRGGEE